MSQFLFEISDSAFTDIAFLLGLFFLLLIFIVLIPLLQWYFNRNPFDLEKREREYKVKEKNGNSSPNQPNQNSN